jgi:hypothetical protein
VPLDPHLERHFTSPVVGHEKLSHFLLGLFHFGLPQSSELRKKQEKDTGRDFAARSYLHKLRLHQSKPSNPKMRSEQKNPYKKLKKA